LYDVASKRCKGEWEICLARPVRLGVDDGGQTVVKIDYELSDRYCKGYRIICEPRWRLA